MTVGSDCGVAVAGTGPLSVNRSERDAEAPEPGLRHRGSGIRMPTLLALSSRIDAISKAAGWIAEWLVLGACLISAANAMVRYLLSYSSNGWLEIQWYMFGALVFLGASHTLRANEHVRVDL